MTKENCSEDDVVDINPKGRPPKKTAQKMMSSISIPMARRGMRYAGVAAAAAVFIAAVVADAATLVRRRRSRGRRRRHLA